METLFSQLFKYRPFYFQQGDFTFQWPLPWWQLGLLGAALAGLLWLAYRGGSFDAAQRRWLLLSRAAVFAVLLVLFMRPSLVLSTLVPRENLIAVLVDDSKSMGLPEADGRPRGAPLEPLLQPDSSFIGALEEKFFVRPYRFAEGAEALELPAQLGRQGDQTNISGALERVLNETRNLPLAGVVLFSDGADNSFRDFAQVMAELSARQIPVHTVGLGPERQEKDVELMQVSAPRTLLPKSLAGVRVTVRQNGFGGSRARLEVREGNVLVRSEEVYLPRDKDSVVVETTISPEREGLQSYEFRILPLEGESILENNSRRALVQVADSRPRILYVEGSPRWEYKFLRRALLEDENLRLETLLRTAPNKFYRQGIEEESTLAAGFPTDPEVLFRYRGIVFGSIESAFFQYGQLELVRDFVGKRGGGFLMLGGSSSYAGGKYRNTPIEQLLPFQLTGSEDGGGYEQGEGMFRSTAYGQRHPALQLDLSAEASDRAWREMAPLIDWNPVGTSKPGATVLAQMEIRSGGSGEVPLLAFQRFGRGHAVALLTGSSWRWQMQADVEDETHETFWRQLLRWLISLSKEPVSVETERETYSRHEPVTIRAEVHDAAFNRLNDARVEATVQGPGGESDTLPLRWNVREDGVYEGVFVPQVDGLYEVSVSARERGAAGKLHGEASAPFLTETGTREFFEAAQRRDFLERLAAETGGRYYTLADVEKIPEEIVYTERSTSQVEVLDLWDMPFNFIVLVGLLVGEWVLRRRYGAI